MHRRSGRQRPAPVGEYYDDTAPPVALWRTSGDAAHRPHWRLRREMADNAAVDCAWSSQ
jgi:hypothetical protein